MVELSATGAGPVAAMLKCLFALCIGGQMCTAVRAAETAPAVWDEIRIGMPVDDATELLRGAHAHASQRRADGSGTKKFGSMRR